MSALNVGNSDRAVRLLCGIVLVGLSVSGAIGPWGYLGLVAMLTGIVGRCPLYALLDVRTTAR